MAEKEKKQKAVKPKKGKGSARIVLPTKNYINLAMVGVKRTDYRVLAAEVLVTVVVVLVFLKFGVLDKLAAMHKAEQEAAQVRHEVNMANEEIENYGELNETYAHYTYSGMTEEELTRVDRIEVLDMVQRIILSQSVVSSWSISRNQLQMAVKSPTLEDVNNIGKQLEKEKIVDYCVITSAATGSEKLVNRFLDTETYIGEEDIVTANITVYLTSEKEDESE